MCWKKWMWIGPLLVLATLLLSVPLLSGCAISRAAGPVKETDPVEPAPVNLPDPAMARDAVLAYIAAHDGPSAPVAGMAWNEENATPGGLVGSTTLRYTAEGWTVTVSYPIVAPEYTLYHVQVVEGASGFTWEGEVDATGSVTETPAPSPKSGQATHAVTGWLGYVVGTPPGAQFDDYVVLLPEGAGQVGIGGATEALEAEIVALRDKPEPGKMAHFWGTLSCEVLDYGACQLLATRLRYGPVATEPEPVEAWQGTLVSNPPGAQFDDYFVLSGDFPVAYGLHALDPQTQAELEALRDTGPSFRVWGALRTGVPDAFGSQIQVTRIEIQ